MQIHFIPGTPADRFLQHLRRRLSRSPAAAATDSSTLHRGDYRANSDELFRIEDLRSDRAIVERVRTGELIDVGVEELDELEPVNTTSRTSGTPGGQHTQEVPDGSRWT